jgi:hypothetical protein
MIRLQEVYGASLFPAQPIMIREIRLRPSAVYGRAFSATISNLQINLSTTARQPDGLSVSFADNVGANDTVVFHGAIALSSAFVGPASGPKAFDIVVPLTTPFLYDPAGGNLCVDWRNYSGSTATFVDAGGSTTDHASRGFAIGANSTGATTLDTGAEVLQIIFGPTGPNEPPIAKASVGSLANLSPRIVNPQIISTNGSNAVIVLDGSLSTDPNNDPLQFAWTVNGVAFSSRMVSTSVLPVGSYTITLTVSDGASTSTDTLLVDIITTGQAVQELMLLVDDSSLARTAKRPLMAILQVAADCLGQGDHMQPCLNQLAAFQNKVRAQIGRTDAALADALMQAAQGIINAADTP